MNRKLLDYFLIFGNPECHSQEEENKYWNRDYITVAQLFMGIIAFPLFAVGWLLNRTIKIKIK